MTTIAAILCVWIAVSLVFTAGFIFAVYRLDNFDRYAGTDIEPAPNALDRDQHARRHMREGDGVGRGVDQFHEAQ